MAVEDGDPSRVEKYLQVLLALAENPPPTSVSELARRVGLGRSSVYRVLEGLEAKEMVHFDTRERRYRLGKAVLGLGLAVFEAMPVRQLAVRQLFELRDITGETATLVTIVGGRLVAVDQAVSRQEPKRVSLIGEPTSLFGRPGGVSALFVAFNQETRALVEALLEAGGKRQVCLALLGQSEEVRRDGYAITEDAHHRTNILSLPVFQGEGIAEFAIAIVGPPDRWTVPRIRECLADCQQVAQQLGAQFAGFEESLF